MTCRCKHQFCHLYVTKTNLDGLYLPSTPVIPSRCGADWKGACTRRGGCTGEWIADEEDDTDGNPRGDRRRPSAPRGLASFLARIPIPRPRSPPPRLPRGQQHRLPAVLPLVQPVQREERERVRPRTCDRDPHRPFDDFVMIVPRDEPVGHHERDRDPRRPNVNYEPLPRNEFGEPIPTGWNIAITPNDRDERPRRSPMVDRRGSPVDMLTFLSEGSPVDAQLPLTFIGGPPGHTRARSDSPERTRPLRVMNVETRAHPPRQRLRRSSHHHPSTLVIPPPLSPDPPQANSRPTARRRTSEGAITLLPQTRTRHAQSSSPPTAYTPAWEQQNGRERRRSTHLTPAQDIRDWLAEVQRPVSDDESSRSSAPQGLGFRAQVKVNNTVRERRGSGLRAR